MILSPASTRCANFGHVWAWRDTKISFHGLLAQARSHGLIVERRLGELINRHGCRRARYRGRAKVFVQQLLGALTANVNRMIRLLDISTAFGR